MSLNNHKIALTIRLLLLALIITVASCRKSDKPSIGVFASPDDAGNALLAAAAADAQAEYFSQLHDGEKTKQYAAKFISDPGKQNGLYWKPSEGQPESTLGPLAAFATAEDYSAKPEGHTAFHGYYFRLLKEQSHKAPNGAKDYVVDGKMTGGFAYPAEYGNSGVMTAILRQGTAFAPRPTSLYEGSRTTPISTWTRLPSSAKSTLSTPVCA